MNLQMSILRRKLVHLACAYMRKQQERAKDCNLGFLITPMICNSWAFSFGATP